MENKKAKRMQECSYTEFINVVSDILVRYEKLFEQEMTN